MEYMQVNRANGRAANELRPVKLTRGVMKHAHGSCLACLLYTSPSPRDTR